MRFSTSFSEALKLPDNPELKFTSMDFARLTAIKQYSDLEYQLCSLLKTALKVDYRAAASIFHRVNNTRARYAIIGDILKIRHRGKFKSSWKGIERWLPRSDQFRNQVVHWDDFSTILATPRGEGEQGFDFTREWHLGNPSKKHSKQEYDTKLTEADVWIERDRMRVMVHIVSRLDATIDEPKRWPWTDIFRLPVSCQNPEEFLARLNDAGRPVQLPPYEKKQLRWPPHPE